MEVRVDDVDAMQVLFVRHTGPYDEVGYIWSQLFAWAGPRGLVGPMPTSFGVLHDDPAVTPPECVRYDACLDILRHDPTLPFDAYSPRCLSQPAAPDAQDAEPRALTRGPLATGMTKPFRVDGPQMR